RRRHVRTSDLPPIRLHHLHHTPTTLIPARQFEPRRATEPSRSPYPMMTDPPARSAHHQPRAALSTRPTRMVAASVPSIMVTFASVWRVTFPSPRPVPAFPAARLNMATRVAPSQVIPSGDESGWMP